ncbi:Transcriptional regulatory protein MoaR1 [Streptomyces sp. ADI96-15]|uniref:AfsR/SARP family transcriptional regulator n=1 Tax=Streptomyces TaxID=1883 RepID=UPI0003C2F5F7|nr:MULTISPECIES: AfsR/SARP family transcriptional regulator [unclassified Streptomyces]ESP95778.1 SARP family regulator SrrY [Streptomyces sp. GBA 94-10 4N24]ESQ01723.1 SARP family regulator SrrY [Streptomyces sp. GBA 94-10 4N24]RPK54471.1 Transcriptional regulatory protein MoaR1 [Streptomyces sp. ADI96-15]UZN57127.1 SARP family regulator SrrY [Streptomyces sp. GBA 94-10 4N24]UZN62962.1 SARP family regulator SrrY [Streptomyces sp. GBA 94-10 4N24]
MDIDVLGALSVRENGVSVTPTAPKPRQVLALLALQADQVVPVRTLIDELWGGRPPRSARTTLQTYVLQLRELISRALRSDLEEAAGRTAKDVLVTLPGGYLLNTSGGTSDVREFERLAGLGYRAMDADDFAGAGRHLGQALALWNGGALADVQTGPQLEMETRRLEETRLCALDQRIEADLRLGRHRELLGELTVLVSRYRTHENLHGQFMLALHRSGRRSEALDAYQRLRNALVRELGLEPSAGLRRLQRSILMTAPEPVPAAAAAGAEHLSRVG